MSQEAIAFQVAWHLSLQKIPAAWGKAESFRSIQPFREKETQTRGTPVSLYEEIQSGHITGEKDLEKLDSF